jgi:DNA-binding XRE family transcriptional regulator
LAGVESSKPSRWKEQALYRRENPWLVYSSQIARRILAIIQNRPDLNQSRLAEMLDVSPQQITKIVKGKENLTLETIYKFSKALDIELISFPEYAFSKPLETDRNK